MRIKKITAKSPGIHLLKGTRRALSSGKTTPYYWWRVVSKNSRVIARSSQLYISKQGAIKSINIAAAILNGQEPASMILLYDHSKGDPVKSFI